MLLYLRKLPVITSQREKKKAAMEEVIGDEMRECYVLPFFARFLRLRAVKKWMNVAHGCGDGTTTLSGDKVIRAGNNERERKS